MNPPLPPPSASRGIALVSALAILVLTTVMVVSFLLSMKTQVVASKSSHDLNNATRLADTCVNLAISQVQTATQTAGAKTYAWASQPGMIRLYDQNGQAAGYYKLYSWDKMIGNGAFSPSGDAALLGTSGHATWSANPGTYTDLNEPAVDGSVTNYPIVDPASIDANATDGSSLANPAAAVSPATAVDQFTLASPPVASDAAANPAPTPVKWLYVLADGSLQVPGSSSSGTRAVIAAATTGNPIVGRIAFWTDDETCKINANTATYGANYGLIPGADPSTWGSTFWDTPHFDTDSDVSFAQNQPFQGEYQRYPGHPATVSLSGVFPNLSTNLFAIVPRESYGGSKSGTVPYFNAQSVPAKSDRLYASIDEILFAPSLSGANRNNNMSLVTLTPAQVRASRFFLTAHSRAPELNLFGKPRVSMWPIHAQSGYRTAVDNLIAFDSTVGAYPFYFTREQAYSLTHDIALARNATLLGYLDTLTTQGIPGFGGNFSAKYGSDCRQILTEIFDYIRCTNLNDPQLSPTGKDYAQSYGAPMSYGMGQAAPAYNATWNTKGFGGRFYVPNEVAIQFVPVGLGAGSSSAVPIPAAHYNNANVDHTLLSGMTGGPPATTPPAGTTVVQAFLLTSFVCPGMGITAQVNENGGVVGYHEAFWLRAESIPGVTQPQVVTSSGNYDLFTLPAVTAGPFNYAGAESNLKRGPRVYQMDFTGLTFNRLLGATPPSGYDYTSIFPFYSKLLPLTTGGKITLTAGSLLLKVYAGQPGTYPVTPPSSNDASLVGTYRVDFPALSAIAVPTPDPTWGTTYTNIGAGGSADRWRTDPNLPGQPALVSTDLVQSMVLGSSGDARLLARPPSTTISPFTSHPLYNVSNRGYSFYGAKNNVLLYTAGGTARGALVNGVSYPNNPPVVPPGVNGVTGTAGSGDWDNGVSMIPDGPWINQPDEGDINTVSGTNAYFDANNANTQATSFYSPNRMMPSPGMLGSLPTGVIAGKPWQTLLFRPSPPYSHPGADSPVDELFLDLFWMPVAQPYALSDPFSTAGKINLNEQIVPFTYIHRYTALRAALSSERVAVMSQTLASSYKGADAGHFPTTITHSNLACRQPLNLSETDGTMRQIVARFNGGDLFRSAAEICGIYLVPQTYSWTSDAAAQAAWYGSDFALVGDNVRERPYADLYAKLTTKSNTYTVHYRVQSLQQASINQRGQPTVFDTAAGDSILAEQRGSATFERYLDLDDSRVTGTDPASAGAASLETYYKVRVLESRLFTP